MMLLLPFITSVSLIDFTALGASAPAKVTVPDTHGSPPLPTDGAKSWSEPWSDCQEPGRNELRWTSCWRNIQISASRCQLLGGSSHEVGYKPSKWINPTHPTYNWGYNLGMIHQIGFKPNIETEQADDFWCFKSFFLVDWTSHEAAGLLCGWQRLVSWKWCL